MSSLLVHIHQGKYDSERELMNLRKNALNNNRVDILDAVNQRLRREHPKLYQRIVGPLFSKSRDIDEDQWLEITSNFESCFSSFVGGESSLRIACENLHYQRPSGLATCKLMFR